MNNGSPPSVLMSRNALVAQITSPFQPQRVLAYFDYQSDYLGAGQGLRIVARSARARRCFRGVFIRVRLLHPCAKWLRRKDGWAELRTRMQEAHTDDTSGGGMEAGARTLSRTQTTYLVEIQLGIVCSIAM